MHTEQPLTSVAAFALALVEASSRLTGTPGPSDGEAATLPVAHDDERVAVAE